MDLSTVINLVNLQTQDLSLFDQILYGCALLSPFCGLIIALTIFIQSKGIWGWIVAWIAPAIWSGSLGFMLFGLPTKHYLLLVASYLLSIPFVVLFYLILFVLSSASIWDGLVRLFRGPGILENVRYLRIEGK